MTIPFQSSPEAPSAKHPAFPWGICAGALVASLPNQGNVLLPTAPGGLLVCFDTGHQAAAVNMVETAALSLVDVLPHRGIEVHVIDFAIRKRVQHLATLAPLKQYRLYDNREAATKALEEMESQARFRHHELLTDATPTLSDYNRQSRGFERYRVLLLNLNDFPGDDARNRERFLTLLDAAFDAGIYLLAYVDTDLLAQSSARQDAPPHVWTLLAQRYPQLNLTAAGEGEFQLLPGPYSQPLLDALAAAGRRMAPPMVDLAAVSAFRRELAASNEGQFRDFLRVPVGETPDGRREVDFCLGEKSDCNNAFILGISGSGKTTFLNNLIVGIAERYTSQEVRLFLMDYKAGVEFQDFADHPNCEKIFLDNLDMAAARQLLEHLQAAMNERGELFRTTGAKDIDSYNAKASPRLPRLLLIVDEVQCLLTGDATGRRFQDLLKDVTRRGRAFGVHIILSTQTLINSHVEKDLMSQIALRVAYKLNNEPDCDRIFNYSNTAPRHLDKFEFIYNADSGFREANIRARALPPPKIAERIAAVRARLPAGLALKPQLMKSAPPATSAAEPAAATPAQPAANRAWQTDALSEEHAARLKGEQDTLARFQARQAAGEFPAPASQDFDTSVEKEPPLAT